MRLLAGAATVFMPLLFSVCVLHWPAPCLAEMQELVGVCSRPLPAVEPAAFFFCRSAAWLEALEAAEKQLPRDADIQLWKLDLSGQAIKTALAAYLFKTGATTPDISASPEIRVYLEPFEEKRLAPVLARPDSLLVLAAMFQEMRATLAEMRGLWPADVASAPAAEDRLNLLGKDLASLWKSAQAIANAPPENSSDEIELAGIADLPVFTALAQGWADLAVKKPQAASLQAGKAIDECGERLAEAANDSQPWQFLMAKALYLRGLAQSQLKQFALARNDFEKALAIMENFSPSLPLQVSLRLAQAGLLRSRGQIAAMCAELERACALGSCAQLAEARRQGECGPQSGGGQ